MTIKVKTASTERKLKALMPVKIKSIIASILQSPFAGNLIKKSGVRFNMFGGYFDYSLVSNTEAAQIFFGIWESAEIRFSKRFARNKNIVELGSCIGVTLGVLGNKFINTHFTCVEANPTNYEVLKIIAGQVSTKNTVSLINKAIAYNDDMVVFNQTTTSGSKLADNRFAPGNLIKIKSVTLSKLLEDENINGPFTLISDIEGTEENIFFEDADALKNCNKIICELEGTKSNSIESQVLQLENLNFILIERYGNVFYFRK